MADLRKKSPGDSIAYPAADWNAFIDAAKAHRAGRGGKGGGPLVFGVDPSLTVLVRNDTGADLDPFAVLAVATDTPTPDVPTAPHAARQLIVLPADTPDAADNAVVVTIDPIADGALGRAVVMGVVPCLVSKGTTGDKWACPLAGDDTQLDGKTSPGVESARILWSEPGTGTKWAVVRLGGGGGGGIADQTKTVEWDSVTDASFDAATCVFTKVTTHFTLTVTFTGGVLDMTLSES